MSEEAARAAAVAVEASNEANETNGTSSTLSATLEPSNPPVTTILAPEPVAAPSENLKDKLEMPAMPATVTSPKKERAKLVLAPWQPDENVTECTLCKKSFNPLLLRFKHHCRICGHIFCGNCTKLTAVKAPDIPPEILTCLPCREAELKRQEKEILRQQQRDALKMEAEHLTDLFAELHRAFEANDEAKAILIKSEIDRLKENIVKREQAKEERLAEKVKVKEEKRAAKAAKKSAVAAEKANGTASTSGTKTKKAGKATTAAKPVNKKPLDTPDTIAVKLETRYGLEPSKLLNPPSDPTRKCLVLDIDYTLFDHKWQPQVRSDRRSDKSMIPLFKRPYLHEFLETCNTKFDIIIWSATGMPAIDNKVGNLGIYTSTRYKITAVFCKDHMIHVTKPRKGGRTYDETVKPLSVIWKLFPEFYGPQNTVHIDDMISNFQLNQGNGVHILPYKESSTSPADTELLYLTKYLMMIANTESDFSVLPHRKWKEWLIDRLWCEQKLPGVSFPPHIPDPPIDNTLLVEAEPVKPKKSALSPPRPSTPANTDATIVTDSNGTKSVTSPITTPITSPKPRSPKQTSAAITIPLITPNSDSKGSTPTTPTSPPSTPFQADIGIPPTGTTPKSTIDQYGQSSTAGTSPEVRSWVRSAVPRNPSLGSPIPSPSSSMSSLPSVHLPSTSSTEQEVSET